MEKCIVLICMVLPVFLSGQEEDLLEKRLFSTQENIERLKGLSSLYEEEEIATLERIENVTEPAESGTIYLVFHLFTDQEKLSSAEVHEQLEILNTAFNSTMDGSYVIAEMNDYASRSAAVGINFCLVEESMLDDNFGAINYIDSPVSSWSIDDAIKFSTSQGAAALHSERLLNIWVADLEETAGYAQLPGHKIETDGIVIDLSYFYDSKADSSEKYAQGKTLIHLVGSYLGLYELWSDDGSCKDDHIADTPIHNAPSIVVGNYKLNRSLCDNSVVMSMNYMDNSPDKDLAMFTKGQKEWMLKVLSPQGPRATVLSQMTCDPTGKKTQIINNSVPNRDSSNQF